MLPAKHPPHLHALQAPEKYRGAANVPKLGIPAPVTCLTRTHRRCPRGGCFAGREKCPAEASPAKRHLDREMFPVGKLPRGSTSAHRTQYAVPPWRMFCRKGRLPRGGTSGSVSVRETSRQGLSGWKSATGSHPRRRRHALHRKGAEDSNMITERDYENILHFACEHGSKQEL